MTSIQDTINLIKNQKFNREQKIDSSSLTKLGEQLSNTTTFLGQVVSGLLWVYKKVIAPTVKKLFIPIKYLFNKYKQLWNKFVYLKPNQYGVRKFSQVRAGVMILATGLVLSGTHLYWDTTVFLLTQQQHISYLNNSQELKDTYNVHAVRGCDEKPVCTKEEAVYYRADPDLFNQIYNILANGSLYYPDFVAAAVPPTTHRCEIYTYGFRWKWLIKNWDIYPEILEVTCYPLVEGK